MIEDLDNDAGAPSRRGHVFVVSVLVAIGCAIGWGAATSTAFQGPFATPAPSREPVMQFIPGATRIHNEPVVATPLVFGCFIKGATTTQVIFVGGQTFTLTQPASVTLPTCPPAPRPPFER